MLDALNDTMMKVLLVAAAVSLVVGCIDDPSQGWMDGVAILVAVMVVVSVASTNDFMKQKQFAKLNVEAGDFRVIVVRGGQEEEVSVYSLMVGDLMHVSSGLIVPVDGVLLRSSSLMLDESTLTGESEPTRKTLGHSMDSPPKPFLVSGSKVIEGTGVMMVCAVGQHSVNGKLKMLLQNDSTEDTPLQVKLEATTKMIGILGFGIASLTFLALVIGIAVRAGARGSWDESDTGQLIASFILAVTVIVMAVPEGLPLAVTLSLAYSVGKMKQENNFVKHLHACETMGAANYICSDKTGTLTTNCMTVSKAVWLEQTGNLPAQHQAFVAENIARNTTAFIGKDGNPIGNPTEGAVLKLVKDWAIDYRSYRKLELQAVQIPFDYKSKRMITAYKEDCYKVYVKGAAEVVLDLCMFEYDSQGTVRAMTEERRAELHGTVKLYADELLRNIVFAYREIPLSAFNLEHYDPVMRPMIEADLIFVGLTGIEDPIRPEVPSAVAKVHRAGLKVIMVTGDNKDTAMRIAVQCNLLKADSDISKAVLLGKDFREAVGGFASNEHGDHEVVNKAAFEAIISSLKVLARSEPEDKYLLVTGLKNLNYVVAVTGDGSNDAPALKKSDVGFAMNLCGTPLAKEAADIILLDDNFNSIVNAVKWGRNIFQSIRKFLQFQLTVNLVALITTLVASISVQTSPLTAVQMLWVNLIMDSFAALALATEVPDEKLLLTQPFGQTESIITPCMWKHILGHSLYQTLWLLTVLFLGPVIFDTDNGIDKKLGEPSQHFTIFFNLFVFFQIFNEFNCRKLKDDQRNVLQNIETNRLFLGIMAVTVLVQALLVQFGG
jgi:calcium-translocating P-type ATPase